MKKLICIVLIATMSMLSMGCGADPKTLSDGKTYDTYGLLNEDAIKNPSVEYRVSGWSLFWGIVFFQTVGAPIYFFGYDLWEPVRLKTESINNKMNGVVK